LKKPSPVPGRRKPPQGRFLLMEIARFIVERRY
jgi:hypothetical protein